MPSNGTEQRKLAAIMFTDMVGYSSLSQRNEALALQLLEEHRTLLRALFPRFNGREVKTIGDAFLVEFHSALEAAQCAIEMQRTLAKRNHDVPADRRIEIKIGIHIGDVVHRSDGDVLGDGVNIASRIEPLAGAGGICVSMDVERQIRNALEARFEKLAPTELKNISVAMDLFRIVLPWEKQAPLALSNRPSQSRLNRTSVLALAGSGVLVVIAAGWFAFHKPGSSRSPQPGVQAPAAELGATPARITSLAVLPFSNPSRDSEQEYFVDGFTELLCTELGGVTALKKVTSRSTIMQYKRTTKKVPEIASELRVDAIVTGSVLRETNLIVVSVQLIEGTSDRQLWATNYEREVGSVLKLKTDLARAIAAAIQAKLTPEEQTRLAGARTVHPAALEAYLKARYYQEHLQSAQAYDHLQQAITLDPSYALAYAQLAGYYVGQAFGGLELPSKLLVREKEAALKALSLDSSLAEAHVAVGWVKMMSDWDWAGAEEEFRRALELNPSLSGAHTMYGFLLTALGRFGEASGQMRIGQELDPLSRASNVWVPFPIYMSGDFDKAIAEARAILARNTNFFPLLGQIGSSYVQKKMFPEALVQFEALLATPWPPTQTQGLLGNAYALTGNKPEALKIVERLKDEKQHRYLPAYEIAYVHAGLGERAETIEWLNQAYEDRSGPIYLLKVEPMFASLRSEPGFVALLRKMHLDK